MSFENPFAVSRGAPDSGAPFRWRASLRRRWNAPDGYRQVLRVSLPLVACMASGTVMQFTDRLFLSHYSIQAIAASVPASMANLLFLLALMGISGYAGVFIAQFVGAGKPERVGAVLWQSLRIAVAGGLLLILLCLPAPWLFGLAGHSEEVLRLELIYFNVLMFGAVFALAGNTLGCFFTGLGFTRPLMLANIVGALINIPLDYALIYGRFGLPELGIFGAGLATAIGWLIMAVLLVFMVFTRANNQIFHVWRGRALDWPLLRRLLRFGLPSGVNMFLEIFVTTLFVFIVGRLGDIDLAATNIVFSINSVSFLPMLGFNIGASILVGQAMGAKNPDGAQRVAVNAMHVGLVWMGVMAVVFLTLPGPLLDLFAVGDDAVVQAQVRQVALVLFYFLVAYCVMDAASLIFGGALKGAGDTWFLMAAMLAGCVLFMFVPVALLFAAGRATLFTIWGCFTLYIGVMSITVLVRFFRGRWKRIRVLGTLEG